MELTDVYLAEGPPTTYNINIENGKITSIQPKTSPPCTTNKKPSILLPSLCHPHIHLEKVFLLFTDYCQYADLVPTSGTFSEALSNTARAKSRYTLSDLERRGSQLIAKSVQAGVTAMRAFVEVDHVVGFLCLEVASMLKRRFEKGCHVQIVAFAQDPIFSTEQWGIEPATVGGSPPGQEIWNRRPRHNALRRNRRGLRAGNHRLCHPDSIGV